MYDLPIVKTWRSTPAELGLHPTHPHYAWLTKPYKLGAAIKQLCNDCRIQVLSQQLAIANVDEHELLRIAADTQSWIRQIYIVADTVPWVYARVVVPQQVYLHYQDELDNLGTRPIGDTLLYQHPHCVRSAFRYGVLAHGPQRLLARCSGFRLPEGELLITEGFLPEICAYVG